MVAITGPLPRPFELAALLVTALAAVVTTVVPATYLATMPAAVAAVAVAAPAGRRVAGAFTVWVPLSLAVVLGTLA